MKVMVLLTIALFPYVNIYGQESFRLPDYPGKWLYLNENNSGEWYDESFYRMNTTELNAYHKTHEKFESFFRNQPLVSHIKGINLSAKSRAMYDHYDHARYPVKNNERVKARLFIQFCPILKRENKIEWFCDEVPYMDIVTNYPKACYESGTSITLLNNLDVCNKMLEMFYMPDSLLDLGDGVILFDWYYENRVVIAVNKRPWWKPVTTREYIERTLAYHKESLKEGNTEEQIVLDAIEKEIALVPEWLLDQPVYLSNELDDRPLLGICSKNEPGARAFCKFNPGYFDNTLPKTTVQLITITIPGHNDSKDYGEIDSQNLWKYIEGLKGADLLKLLSTN